MKSIKTIGIILIFSLQSNLMLSQNSFEIEGNYALTSEKLVANDESFYESVLFHSFGVNAKKIYDSNLFIKGGLYLRRLGAKFTDERALPQMPVGTTEFYEVKLSAKGIDIPVSLGFYF